MYAKEKKIQLRYLLITGMIVLTTACAQYNYKLQAALREGAYLVDVRTPEEFAEASAANAVNAPLDALEAHIAELKSKGKIVVFCRSGNRSGQAKRILKKHGFTGVVNGGSWQSVLAMQNRKSEK